jgi:MoaA/NifB/PqqE/SkfB family radical SAM enzyme
MNNKYITEDGEHKNDVIVSWIITHGCQERCAYCISPEKCKEITDFDTHKKIQDQMIATGLTKNRYIGGEPLLIPHLGELIKEAKEAGLNTRLSTNGILLTKEKLLELREYLNSIAFPFESCNDELNQNIRGTKNHREIVSSRIKMVKELSDMGVLVNTCVHKENIHELEKLAYHLDDLGIDHWKLRKFNSSSGRGAVPNKNRFEITEDEFFEVVNYLQSLGLNYRIDGRLPSKLNTRLMVSPTGELYRMVGGDDEQIHYGNVLTRKLNIKNIYDRDGCN